MNRRLRRWIIGQLLYLLMLAFGFGGWGYIILFPSYNLPSNLWLLTVFGTGILLALATAYFIIKYSRND